MIQLNPKWFLGAFWASSVAEIASILFTLDEIHRVAKPLLMISLMLYFLAASHGFPNWRRWVAMALAFSWLGDVFLMNDNLFVVGLGSFLIAHLFYIVAYSQTGAKTGTLKVVDGLKFVAVGIALMWVLYPGLGDMLIPVLLYAFVLLMMAVLAHKRRGSTSDLSFTLVAVGAMLFVISDALIAVDKFAFEVPYSSLMVMITYITAQYMIVSGLLKHE